MTDTKLTLSPNQAIAMMKIQMDPDLFLLMISQSSAQAMYVLQTNTALVQEDNTTIAEGVINQGQQTLAAYAKKVADDTDQNNIQKDSSAYSYESTRITNLNDSFNTVTQAGQTAVSDITRQESNAMEATSSVLEFMSGMTNLLTGWGS